MTVDGGDRLLYAVSARRDMRWPAFKSAADALFSHDLGIAPAMKQVRFLAASMGDALGHWDVFTSDGEETRICIAPPSLARLPWPGRPRAVLCGSRSPDTLADLVAAVSTGVAVRQRHVHPLAPSRIEVTARTNAELAALAGRLGVSYNPEPAAWMLASASCDVHEYVQSLDWSPESDLNWPCQVFDPQRLTFEAYPELHRTQPERSPQPRLLTYEHPDGWARRNRLTWAGRMAAVDRAWGRYVVLAAAGRQVLRVDKRSGTVRVPRQLPLPKLLGRALALSSGEPPRAEPGQGLGDHLYASVPAAIIDAVANKVRQDLPGLDRVLEGAVR